MNRTNISKNSKHDLAQPSAPPGTTITFFFRSSRLVKKWNTIPSPGVCTCVHTGACARVAARGARAPAARRVRVASRLTLHRFTFHLAEQIGVFYAFSVAQVAAGGAGGARAPPARLHTPRLLRARHATHLRPHSRRAPTQTLLCLTLLEQLSQNLSISRHQRPCQSILITFG